MDDAARDRRKKRDEIRREHGLGMRKKRSARLSIPIEKRLTGTCLVCGNVAHACICSGMMTEAAQKRFYESRR